MAGLGKARKPAAYAAVVVAVGQQNTAIIFVHNSVSEEDATRRLAPAELLWRTTTSPRLDTT